MLFCFFLWFTVGRKVRTSNPSWFLSLPRTSWSPVQRNTVSVKGSIVWWNKENTSASAALRPARSLGPEWSDSSDSRCESRRDALRTHWRCELSVWKHTLIPKVTWPGSAGTRFKTGSVSVKLLPQAAATASTAAGRSHTPESEPSWVRRAGEQLQQMVTGRWFFTTAEPVGSGRLVR